MRVVIFGLGRYYQENKRKLAESDIDIIAASDNNSVFWGKEIDGIHVISPKEISSLDCDYIVVTNKVYYVQIEQQLLEYGIKRDKIKKGDIFIETIQRGVLKTYFPTANTVEGIRGKLVFVSTDLEYNGGSLAIIYAAMACRELGYTPVILIPEAEKKIVSEFRKEGITFLIYPNLRHASIEELFWLKESSCIIVNTFQMVHCAIEISKKYPLIWWLHEPIEVYELYKELYDRYKEENFSKMKICSVTQRAGKNFSFLFPSVNPQELLLGIPDIYNAGQKVSCRNKKKLIFAVIGVVCSRKAQDLFLEAIYQNPVLEMAEAEYWIIGSIVDDEYSKKILELSKGNEKIKILGKKTQEEMKKLYPQIDVVVVCSKEETLSIVAIEAMMHEKVSIVSDNCGIADYMMDGENGLIYHGEATDELAAKMEWCMTHRTEMEVMGRKARQLYERVFSMQAFKERLKSVFDDLSLHKNQTGEETKQ